MNEIRTKEDFIDAIHARLKATGTPPVPTRFQIEQVFQCVADICAAPPDNPQRTLAVETLMRYGLLRRPKSVY